MKVKRSNKKLIIAQNVLFRIVFMVRNVKFVKLLILNIKKILKLSKNKISAHYQLHKL